MSSKKRFDSKNFALVTSGMVRVTPTPVVVIFNSGTRAEGNKSQHVRIHYQPLWFLRMLYREQSRMAIVNVYTGPSLLDWERWECGKMGDGEYNRPEYDSTVYVKNKFENIYADVLNGMLTDFELKLVLAFNEGGDKAADDVYNLEYAPRAKRVAVVKDMSNKQVKKTATALKKAVYAWTKNV